MPLSRRAFVIAAATFPLAGRAFAATPEIYAGGGVAIDGSDTVAYFTERRPVAGSPDFTHDWKGATWRFASAANRDAFAATPEAYAPQFGGWCAWAVSRNYTAPTIPEAWTIHGGKLYLNATLRVQDRWRRRIDENIARGNANWPGVLA